jgi:chromosomal replication initiation ATPase DnaA
LSNNRTGEPDAGSRTVDRACAHDGARQLALGLPALRPAYDRARYIVTENNRLALLAAERFFDTPENLLCIVGPPRSGKSHLLHILAEARDGGVADPRRLPSSIAPGALIAIDDADGAEPQAFLALLAAIKAAGGKALAAGDGAPESWAKGQSDLASRLAAAPCVALCEPDEDLLVAVIAKHFADRQLRVRPEIARHAALRLPKTFAAAAEFVNRLDALALAERAELSLKLANRVLANLSEEPPAT